MSFARQRKRHLHSIFFVLGVRKIDLWLTNNVRQLNHSSPRTIPLFIHEHRLRATHTRTLTAHDDINRKIYAFSWEFSSFFASSSSSIYLRQSSTSMLICITQTWSNWFVIAAKIGMSSMHKFYLFILVNYLRHSTLEFFFEFESDTRVLFGKLSTIPRIGKCLPKENPVFFSRTKFKREKHAKSMKMLRRPNVSFSLLISRSVWLHQHTHNVVSTKPSDELNYYCLCTICCSRMVRIRVRTQRHTHTHTHTGSRASESRTKQTRYMCARALLVWRPMCVNEEIGIVSPEQR